MLFYSQGWTSWSIYPWGPWGLYGSVFCRVCAQALQLYEMASEKTSVTKHVWTTLVTVSPLCGSSAHLNRLKALRNPMVEKPNIYPSEVTLSFGRETYWRGNVRAAICLVSSMLAGWGNVRSCLLPGFICNLRTCANCWLQWTLLSLDTHSPADTLLHPRVRPCLPRTYWLVWSCSREYRESFAVPRPLWAPSHSALLQSSRGMWVSFYCHSTT